MGVCVFAQTLFYLRSEARSAVSQSGLLADDYQV